MSFCNSKKWNLSVREGNTSTDYIILLKVDDMNLYVISVNFFTSIF